MAVSLSGTAIAFLAFAWSGWTHASLRDRSTCSQVSPVTFAARSPVASELASGGPRPEPGRERLVETRRDVVRGWNAMARLLDEQGHRELATVVRSSWNGCRRRGRSGQLRWPASDDDIADARHAAQGADSGVIASERHY